MRMNLGRRRLNGDETQIREFVYLDETSVESLLASVDGEILVQRTNTSSRSSEAGIAAQADGKTPFGKVSFAPTLKKSSGSEVQELRKSVAQSAFARFRSNNFQQFVIRPLASGAKRRKIKRLLDELEPKALRKLGQGIPLDELRRGDLLEVETDLVAADIFKARTAISAVTDVVEAYPSFLTVELRDQLKLARPLTSLIDSLNGNAIPVVGENPSIYVSEINGRKWLMSGYSSDHDSVEHNLALEGQALRPWFWGDVGRILFRPARFRMLCRVLNPSLTNAPSSSYTGTILRTIDDGLASTVDGLGSMFLGALRSGHQAAAQKADEHVSSSPVVSRYVEKLAFAIADAELVLPPEVEAHLSTLDLHALPTSAQTDVFLIIDRALDLRPATIGEDALSALRDDIRTEFGLWPWSPAQITQAADVAPERATSFLEVAIVAVYW